MHYVLTINGLEHELDAAPETPLLEILREDLGLFGAKYGCGEGKCGACVVLVEGEPLPACTLRVGEVGGRPIVTIEGLADGDDLDPVQDAFVAEHAMQCGYCTSGMVMAATALLEKVADPGDEDIRRALGGHICRCGQYGRVVSAVRRAARGER